MEILNLTLGFDVCFVQEDGCILDLTFVPVRMSVSLFIGRAPNGLRNRRGGLARLPDRYVTKFCGVLPALRGDSPVRWTRCWAGLTRLNPIY